MLLSLLFIAFFGKATLCSILLVETNVSSDAVACNIDPFAGGLPTPLLIQNNSFIYPQGAGNKNLKFTAGENIDLACPEGALILRDVEFSSLVTATCLSDTTFTINSTSYKWSEIRCSDNPKAIVELTPALCETDGTKVRIGYEIAKSEFVKNLEVCFNTTGQFPMYSYYELIPAIDQEITGTPTPTFDQGPDVYEIGNINTLYTLFTQRATINGQLGMTSDNATYIQNNDDYVLARGHLAGGPDFFYASQQNSTYYYENALPQWQTFHDSNWEHVETDVRNYASHNNVQLQIWTGGYGITTLPHADTGVETPLFLYVIRSESAIPIPEVFWKVVYNPKNQLGIVLIGANNPYKTPQQINKFCVDVSSSLSWLTWEKDDQIKGISWACDVDDFRKSFNNFPAFNVMGLLK